MSGIFSKKSNSQKTKAVSALQVQTSSYGPVLPLVYGKNRIAGNLGWYGNWKATGHKDSSSAGGKGGSSSGDTSYTYTTGVIIMLCEGQVQGIGTIWNDTATDTLSSLGMTFFNGATPQPAWSWLASYDAAQSLPYSGVSYVAASALSLGQSTSLPNYNFEVAALLPFDAGTVDDALPTDILTDYLTDPHHGAGFGSYLADLTDLRNYCLARELFLSVIEDEQRTAADFLSDMATWCNFAPVWSFNQLKMIPYGDADLSSAHGSYSADVQPVYDLGADDFLYSDGSDAGVELDWKDIEDCHNSVRIEYNDRANGYNSVVQQAIDQADIDARGLYAMSDVQITGITDATTALHVAQLMLQRDLYIRKTYTFSTDMRYMLLEPMDVVTLTDPNAGLDRELVRITKVTEQNDSLQFEAEELPIGVATAAKNAPQTTSAFSQDTNVAPGNVSAPVIFNGPKALTASGYESWIAVAGLGTFWAGCDVYASSDGDTYDLVGRVTAPARYGALTAELPEGADPDTTNTMTAKLLTGQLVSGTQDDADSWNQFAFVDGAQGGEFVAFETATLQADGSYAMGYLRRGGYGTISQDHASGDSWVRIDNTILRVPYDYGKRGSTIYFKFCSFNSFGKATQSLAEVQAYPHVLGISSVPTLASLTASDDVVFGINLGWTFLPGTEFIRGTEIWYGTTDVRDQATKLGEFAYPQANTSLIGLAPGATLYFWGRLVDTTGNYSDWFPVSGAVSGAASTDASLILKYLGGQLSQTELADDLRTQIQSIDPMSETIIKQSLMMNGNNDDARSNRAYIAEVDSTKATADEAQAIAQKIVAAQVGPLASSVETFSKAQADTDGRLSATWGAKVQVTKNGVPYLAGLGVGIATDDAGKPISTILMEADQVGIIESADGDVSADSVTYPWIVKGGVVYMNIAMIEDGTIDFAKIGSVIESDNFIWDDSTGLYRGWQMLKNGQVRIAGDASIKGDLDAKSITGAMQTSTPINVSGLDIVSRDGGTAATVALGLPVRFGQQHSPMFQLSATLNNAGGSASSPVRDIRLGIERNDSSGWTRLWTQTYRLGPADITSVAINFMDSPTNAAQTYRIVVDAVATSSVGTTNDGIWLSAISGLLLGYR